MGGRQRHSLTREALRFHYLIVQYERQGITQSELSRRTGIHQTYLSKFRNPENSGRTSIGAEIIRAIKEGLQVSPNFFFDDYEGERPVSLYPINAEREKARNSDVDAQITELKEQVAWLLAQRATEAVVPPPARVIGPPKRSPKRPR